MAEMPKTLPVRGCARCGGEHGAVVFKPFDMPPPAYSHFGICPVSGDPILMREFTIPPAKGQA